MRLLQGGSSSKSTVQNGVLGDALLDREDSGWVPPQGVPLDEKNAAEEDQGRYVDLSATRKGHIGSGTGGGGGGDIFPTPPEYHLPVHCH